MYVYVHICLYVYVSSFSPATNTMLRINMLRITETRCRLNQPCSEAVYSGPCTLFWTDAVVTILMHQRVFRIAFRIYVH